MKLDDLLHLQNFIPNDFWIFSKWNLSLYGKDWLAVRIKWDQIYKHLLHN